MSGAAVDPMGNVALGGAPEPVQLPTEDEFFGAEHLPSEEDFFGPRAPKAAPQAAELAGLMPPEPEDVASGGSRVLSAFGQGIAQGWGASAGHFGPEIESLLAKAGILKDVNEGQASILQAFNGAILRPAATAIDWSLSGVAALTSGSLAAIEEVAGRDPAAMAEWYVTTGNTMGGAGVPPVIAAPGRALMFGLAAASRFRIPPPVARVLPEASYGRFDAAFERWDAARAARADMREAGERARNASFDLYEAYAEGVIGRGERAYFGLEDALMPDPVLGARAAEAAPEIPQAPARPADVHAAAREAKPDLFAEYDALAERRDVLRGQIADAQAEVQRNAAAQAPGAAEIADLRERMKDTTPRLAKKYEARIAELQAEHDAFLADADKMALLTRETPEIAEMRRELMEADYRMRDLSPEVSAAYREAAKDFPEVVERPAEPAVVAREPVAEPARPVEATTTASAGAEKSNAPKADPSPALRSKVVPTDGVPADAPLRTEPVRDFDGRQLAVGDQVVVYGTEGLHEGPVIGFIDDPTHGPGAVVQTWGGRILMAYGDGPGQSPIRTHPKPNGGTLNVMRPDGTLPADILTAEQARAGTIGRDAYHQAKAAGADAATALAAAERASQDALAGRPPQSAPVAESGPARAAATVAPSDAAPRTIRMPDGRVIEIPARKLPTDPAVEPVRATQGDAAAPAESTAPRTPINIADDVAAKLRAAGRPADEAAASAAVVESYWTTRAAHLGEDAGELYARLGSDIRAGGEGGRAGMGQGKIRLPALELAQDARGRTAINEGRAIITLFDKADASTFMHETGHEWLERMIADGRMADAPVGFVQNADAVRKWLGMEADQAVPTTRQHERFARAFEQYLREGHAPSRALDGVFSQFRDWLTKIYETIKRLGKPINEDIRAVFDRLLAEKPERAVIAPERELVTEKSSPAYMPVPKPPESLLSFLKRKGGLKDVEGDVAAIIGGPKGRPGLINKNDTIVRDGKVIYRGGMELDEAGRMAWEEGYFPGLAEPPDMHTLQRAIEEEARGTPRYSEHDAAAVEAHRDAVESNNEIARLESEYGIDATKLTREEFFDRVAEKMAEADLEREISNAATHVDDFVDEARHWYEDYADERRPRTLEDAEREWRDAEKAPASVEPRQSGDEGAGRAGRPVQDGQGKPGQGGGGAADGRGAGPSPSIDRTESPAGPNQPFGSSPGPLVDKAGNIRVDNLNVPEDVARGIREAAEQNEGFIGARRGVVSDSQVMELADALGMTPQDLAKRKIGEAYNAEQVMAARKLLIDSATQVRDLMRKAAEGGEADVLAYAEARARHLMIQEQVSGITAEAGRALRAFRMIGEDKALLQNVDAAIRDATGRTLFQMQEEARRGAALETPAQVSKFIRDSEKPGFTQMIAEFWMNSLLSGPQTHMANVLGNSIVAVSSILETGMAGAVGGVRRALGGKGGVELAEARAELFGLVQGAQDGLKVGWQAFREQDFNIGGKPAQAELFQVDPKLFRAIPSATIAGHEVGGKQIRLPTRALGAEDAFFRSVAYRKSINAQAMRTAMQEGLEGPALNSRVAELATNPSEAMMKEAVKQSSYATFTNDLGKVGKAMQQLSNSHLAAKFLLPFIRTPINIAKYALERTPVSLMSGEVRANLLGKNGPAALDQQVGRLAMGTAITVGILALAQQGLVTGSGPDDPKEMAMWRLSGKQPYSIRVGDTWYSVRRFDPLGFLFSVVADAHEAGSQLGEKPIEKIGLMLANSVGKSFLEGTGMKGLADAVKAATDPERYGGHWAKSFLSTFYPFGGAAGQMARAIDPYARQTRTFMDELKAKTPFLSQSLPPKYDIFGQPVPSREALGPDALSVLYMRQVNDDPVIQAMTRLHIFPGAVGKTIRGVELTPEEYAEYAGSAGRLMKMQLDALIGVKGFTSLPDGAQQQVINRTIAGARETAAGMMQMNHPRLITEALDAKKKVLIEGKKPK